MNYSDDGYAAMLLTMALSPDREEYARPYSVQELRRLEAAVRNTEIKRIGGLLSVDISGLMIYLGLPEEEAYRTFTLLHRSVQLTYALEGFSRQGVEVITSYDAEYPQRLPRKLGDAAPPFFYRCGSAKLLERPHIAIVGIRGVRTDSNMRNAIEALVRNATAKGYGVLTGGELGVSRVAESLVAQCGGTLLEVLGGGMQEQIHREDIAELIATDRCAVLSVEHPEAMFTLSHAVARNRLLFSLADAAFVFNTDGRRGESEAIQNRYCDWIYAWEDFPENRALIARGAIALNGRTPIDFNAMSQHWNSSSAEQLNMFDLF